MTSVWGGALMSIQMHFAAMQLTRFTVAVLAVTQIGDRVFPDAGWLIFIGFFLAVFIVGGIPFRWISATCRVCHGVVACRGWVFMHYKCHGCGQAKSIQAISVETGGD